MKKISLWPLFAGSIVALIILIATGTTCITWNIWICVISFVIWVGHELWKLLKHN